MLLLPHCIPDSRGGRRLTDAGRQLWPQHFDCHSTIMPEILGGEDARHAAAAKLRLDGVASSQGGLEAGLKVGHIRS